jgi:hypothetical protein
MASASWSLVMPSVFHGISTELLLGFLILKNKTFAGFTTKSKGFRFSAESSAEPSTHPIG